jgi:MFS family permease
MTAINSSFIQPLLIARGAGQLALGIYISGSSLVGFSAGWVGPTLASRIGNSARMVLGTIGIGRIAFLLLTGYLLFFGNVQPELLIALILLWGLGEGLAGPIWTSFVAGMVDASERGRWIAMRGQAATAMTVPILVAILLLVMFASKDQVLPVAYSLAAIGAAVSWFSLRRVFASSPEQPAPAKRSLAHMPESRQARTFLAGTFLFWFASALTWPIIPRHLVNHLHAPTAYFAISPIIGAFIGIVLQPRWGRFGDRSGACRILLLSGVGLSIVPLLWAIAPVYWFGWVVDSVAFCFWPGHTLGLTLRAVELVDNDGDRPMMLGWTNLAQGAGATLSPLIASMTISELSLPVILVMAFALRLVSSWVISGAVPRMARQPVPAPSTA